ncbi:MAG: ABC transporter substrate-binding protein [Verrucomicrobiota bacterium]
MTSSFTSFSGFLLCLLLLSGGCSRHPLPPRPQTPLSGDEDVVSFPNGKFGSRLVDISISEPKTLNPLNSTDASSASIIALLHAGLTSYDPVQEKVTPALAKSWEISADFKKYTFHLRQGLQFSDGHPITSQDVAFTFRAIYDSRYPNRTKDLMSIEGKTFQISTPDSLTVVIELPGVYAPFLQMIGDVEILPHHLLQDAYDSGNLLKIWTSGMAKTSPERFVGAGMFKILSYQTGQRMLLIPNPYYWQTNLDHQRLPYVDLYLIKFVQDINASVIEFATGQCDSMGIPPDQWAWVKKNEKKRDFTLYDRGPSSTISFIWFNLNPGENKEKKPFVAPYKMKWFQDKRFRQAVSYAIDRQGIVDGVLLGRGAPLTSFYSPANGKWHNPKTPSYPFDLEKSKSLLSEMGMKLDDHQLLHDASGKLVEFTLITNQENQIRQNIATTIKENLKLIGITVHLQFQDFNTFISKIDQSFDYEAGILGLTGGGDPAGSLSVLKSSGQMNLWYPQQKEPFTAWQARIDQLMDLQMSIMDEPKRIEMVREIQSILSEELPLIYLVTPTSYVGIRNKWKNIQIPKNGSPLWNLESLWAP